MNSQDFNVHTECERAAILLDALLRAEAMDFDRIRDIGRMTLQYQQTATKRMEALRAAKAVLREFVECGIDTTQAQDIKEWLMANRYFGAPSDEDAEPEDHTGDVFRVIYRTSKDRKAANREAVWYDGNAEGIEDDDAALAAEIVEDHCDQLPASVTAEDIQIIERGYIDRWEYEHEFQR